MFGDCYVLLLLLLSLCSGLYWVVVMIAAIVFLVLVVCVLPLVLVHIRLLFVYVVVNWLFVVLLYDMTNPRRNAHIGNTPH